MDRYKWNAFIAKLTNKFRYSKPEEKREKVLNNTYDEEGKCLFCKIIQGEVLFKDDQIAVFKDKKEDARYHLLVVPVEHISNLHSLNESHIGLIRRMEEAAVEFLGKIDGGEYVIGFHHPPRNSIDHLHMHGIIKPLYKMKSKLSYSKWLWFITPDQVILRLNRGW